MREKSGNFKTRNFFGYPESFLYCLYSKNKKDFKPAKPQVTSGLSLDVSRLDWTADASATSSATRPFSEARFHDNALYNLCSGLSEVS